MEILKFDTTKTFIRAQKNNAKIRTTCIGNRIFISILQRHTKKIRFLGPHMNTLEKHHIHKTYQQGIHSNDTHSSLCNSSPLHIPHNHLMMVYTDQNMLFIEQKKVVCVTAPPLFVFKHRKQDGALQETA
jgi:hypothetical protein